MKGYRTVLLNAGMTLLAGGGLQFADLPANVRAWLTLLSLVWGFAAILLRLVTTTPIGQKIEAALEHDLGITPEEMAALVARLPQRADISTLTQQLNAISAAVATVRTATANLPLAATDPAASAA